MKKNTLPDIYLTLIVSILIIFGVVAIYNTSIVYLESQENFFGHIGVLIFSVILSIALTFLKNIEKILDKSVPWVLGITIFFLVLVIIPGVALRAGGAGRWLDVFGLFTFQPSELAKLSIALYLANVLSKKGEKLSTLKKGLLPPLSVLILMIMLIIIEPDFGTAMLFAIVGFSIFFYAGVPLRYLIATGIIVLGIFILLITQNPYMSERIKGYNNKNSYQTEQAKESFRQGGLAGNKFENIIEKPVHLPAAITDFMLASFAQHYGFFGCALVVILFFLFMIRGFVLVDRMENMFLKYLAFAIVVFITSQAYLNILVSIAAIPTTGMPLPFISYGRNTLFITMIGVGVLLNITRGVQK